MGGHAKPKEVVYKDTNDFEYTPKYVYPVSILNRYLFFWGTAKKFKAAINFAKHFLAPNHICFVYLLGEINTGTVEKAYADVDLSATPLVVSWSANVQQAVATYDQLYKDGLDTAEKNFPSPEYIEENHLANLRRAINATDIAERDREIAQTVYDTYKGYYDKMMAKRMAMQEFLDEFTRGAAGHGQLVWIYSFLPRRTLCCLNRNCEANIPNGYRNDESVAVHILSFRRP